MAIERGGAMHERSVAFFEWAARYDDGGMEMRSRALHEAWMAGLRCRTGQVDGTASVEDVVGTIERMAGVDSG